MDRAASKPRLKINAYPALRPASALLVFQLHRDEALLIG
jgi:hypothetical protein